ncbi:MAG: hypothetical protein JRG79_13955, partial [Deltaproteobacteria bacterium]|nr:hypothetical protein [Deltaproteobacteria bacterium]
MMEENRKDHQIGPGETKNFEALLHYWFIQYNPLYFFSALCMLGGMFLLSRGLTEMDWHGGQLFLTGVVQTYEIILIAGAALLFRTQGQRRPAVILGLMEAFFLFDGTFRTEMIASLGSHGLVWAGAWMAMTALKLWAMVWAFRLKISASAFFLPLLAAFWIALFPQALERANIDKSWVHLLAIWYGVGLVMCAKFLKPRVGCTIMLDAWGRKVLRRSSMAAWGMWAGFYLFHLLIWSAMFHIPFTAAQAAPFILLLFLLKGEIWAWSAGAAIIALSATFPGFVTPAAIIVGIFYVLKGGQDKRRRLYVGAVVSIYIGVWTLGWTGGALPELNLWLNGTAIVVLLAMAWGLRLPSAIPAAL